MVAVVGVRMFLFLVLLFLFSWTQDQASGWAMEPWPRASGRPGVAGWRKRRKDRLRDY